MFSVWTVTTHPSRYLKFLHQENNLVSQLKIPTSIQWIIQIKGIEIDWHCL